MFNIIFEWTVTVLEFTIETVDNFKKQLKAHQFRPAC